MSMLGLFSRRLDELLQCLVLDVGRGPFWNLIAGEISAKLHLVVSGCSVSVGPILRQVMT